jgi:dCMP deaminase
MRPNKDQVFMAMARIMALRGTCVRRKVGCILTNEMGQVIGTGYNGPARGLPNCIEAPCKGASLPSGEGLEVCRPFMLSRMPCCSAIM